MLYNPGHGRVKLHVQALAQSGTLLIVIRRGLVQLAPRGPRNNGGHERRL
jgi:hypothetical protein